MLNRDYAKMSVEERKVFTTELAKEAKNGNNEAFDALYRYTYKLRNKLATQYAEKYRNFHIDEDDLMEAFDYAMMKALRTYDFDNPSAPFVGYLKRAFDNEAKNLLKDANRVKRRAYRDSQSLNQPITIGKDSDTAYVEDLAADTSAQFDEDSVTKMVLPELITKAIDNLRDKDKEIVKLLAANWDNKAVQRETIRDYLNSLSDKPVKDATIRSAIKRARQRLAIQLHNLGYDIPGYTGKRN